LQHDRQDRDGRPAKFQDGKRRVKLAQVDLMGNVPKARAGHDQLDCEQDELSHATLAPARSVAIIDQTAAHPSSVALRYPMLKQQQPIAICTCSLGGPSFTDLNTKSAQS
jgi:hypothetical protein